MPRRKVFRDSDSEDGENRLNRVEPNEDSDSVVEEDDMDNEEQSHDNLLISSDSDSAPEDVSFGAGKEDALGKVKIALKQIEQEKNRQKQKRKFKEDIYKQQKKEKLEALAKAKLPSEFLDDLSSEPVVKKSTKTELKTESKLPQEDSDGESEHSDFADNEEEDEHYISLGNDRLADFKIVAIKEDLKKSKTSSQTAAEFKHKMLYGSRIRREPVQAKIAKTLKKKAQFSRR